jgi:predicted RNase H-like nuclease (RuvC/YqgF family)
MHRMFLKIAAIALLINSAAYGQSLGDVARENREKKAEDASAAQPKVITNKDLPHDPDANQEPPEAQSGAGAAASSEAADHRSAQQSLAEQRAADQWKRQILAQKNKMAILQARIDKLNASIRSVDGTVQYEGPRNRYQARQLERVAQIQQQLDEQKMKLDQMQEAARHAGMHTAVYDP